MRSSGVHLERERFEDARTAGNGAGDVAEHHRHLGLLAWVPYWRARAEAPRADLA